MIHMGTTRLMSQGFCFSRPTPKNLMPKYLSIDDTNHSRKICAEWLAILYFIKVMVLIINAAQQQIKEGSKRERRRIQSNQVEAKY